MSQTKEINEQAEIYTFNWLKDKCPEEWMIKFGALNLADVIEDAHKAGSQWQAARQQRQVERLTKALEFYAEKSNWVSRSGKIGICLIDTDDRESFGPEYPWAGGKRAREALGVFK